MPYLPLAVDLSGSRAWTNGSYVLGSLRFRRVFLKIIINLNCLLHIDSNSSSYYLVLNKVVN